ncbi:uncharacterized protein BDV14DRAFT_173984 [Aspergillus stella-maris]|uniref:uncharacterized protein n=1 Tax=Aspergillus stella-maris TaxID=1810926 RepID=UPI003CCC9B22
MSLTAAPRRSKRSTMPIKCNKYSGPRWNGLSFTSPQALVCGTGISVLLRIALSASTLMSICFRHVHGGYYLRSEEAEEVEKSRLGLIPSRDSSKLSRRCAARSSRDCDQSDLTTCAS